MAKSYNSIKAFKVGKTFEDERNKKSYKDIKSSEYDFGVDDDYIKSFYEDFDKYSSDAEKDYDGITYGSDVSGLYDRYFSQSADLRDRASTIRAYLNSQKNNIDGESYSELVKSLDSFGTFSDDVLKGFEKQRDFYTTFDTEYDYNAYVLNNTKGTDNDSITSRKGAYDLISARVSELENEIEATGYNNNNVYTRGGGVVNTSDKETTDKYNSLVKEKDRLEAELRKYEYGNKTTDDLYSQYSANEDWEEDSRNRNFNRPNERDLGRYGSSFDITTGERYDIDESVVTMEDPLGTYFAFYNGEDGYQYGLVQPPSLDLETDKKTRASQHTDAYNLAIEKGESQHWEHLTDDEVNLYYYMLSNGLKEQALSYLDGMEIELDRRASVEYQKELENAGLLEMVFHNVVSIPANIIGGAAAFVGDAFDLAIGNEINPYDGGHAIQNYAQGVRSATANDINRLTGASEDDWLTWGDAYQGIMSAADSVVGGTLLGPTGYGIVMGMGAASSEAKELYEAGASKGQIIAGGILAGVAEAVFEKVSVEHFLKNVVNTPSKNGWQWVYKTLLASGIEGSEELFTTIANYVTDASVRGNTSDWESIIDKYKKQGLTDGQALWKAVKYVGGEALHDAAVGAISGGGMGVVGNTISAINYDSAAKTYGKEIIDEGGVDTLKNLALDMAGAQGGVSNLVNNAALKHRAKVASKADTTTKKGAKAVGVLADTVDSTRVKQNKADLVKSLQEKGVDKAKAKEYADILFEMNEEYFAGKDVFTLGTNEQWKKITGDENAYSILRNIVTDEKSPVNIRNLAVGNAKRGIRVGAEGELNEADVAAYQERRVTQFIQATAEANGIQQDVENNFDVSEDGKTYANIGNSTIEVTSTEFVDGEDGVLKVKVNGEQEVDTGSVSYSNVGEALVVSAIVDMGIGAEDANSLFGMLEGINEKTGKAYANGISLAFKYGRYFYSPSKLDGIVSVPKKVAQEAFRIGIESRSKATKASQAQLNETAEANTKDGKKVSAKGSVVYEGTIADENGNLAAGEDSLTDIQKASVNGLKLIAELSPLNFHIFQSEKDGDTYTYVKQNGEETHANGWYRVGTNDIYIDLNAGVTGEGTMMYTAAHEISHFIKQYSPEKWDKIAEYIMNEYCTHYGGKVDALLLKHIMAVKARPDSKNKTQQEIEDEAFEDLVCDSLSKMLIDGTVVDAMANIKKRDKGAWNTIKNAVLKLLEKWGVVIDQYKGRNPDAEEAGYFRETSKAFKKLQGMLTEAFVDAGETYSKVGNLKSKQSDVMSDRATAEESKAIKSLGKGANVELNENGDMLVATNKDGSTVMYSERTWRMGGKEKFIATMTALGHGDQAQEYAKYLDDALGYLHELAVGYEILGKHLDADIVTDIKNGNQVLSAIVNNGEYPVNIDLALICKKRVAYMRLMAKMIEDGVFGDVKYDGDAIAEVNKILRNNGFETACLGCFVESRRLQFQTWAETIVQEWNEAVEARNKYAHYFRFADGKASLTDAEIEALDKELASGGKKNDKGNLNLGKGSVASKMSRLLDKVPSLARKLTVDDLLTPQGLTALRATDSNLFSLVKQRYGAASPKIVQDYNPYASEIADLTFNFVKKVTGNNVKGAQEYIKQAKKEIGDAPKKLKSESKEEFKKRKAEYDAKVEALAMKKYLYSIGGARIQSFSDFMIENVFDYLQIFADLAAKELPMHGYTKEIVALRLFGMSGTKWNGSLIAHVEKSMGKEYAGLLPASEAKNGNGILVKVDGKDYCIAFDDYARNKATNGKSFIQSIGMKDIIALMYDPRYSPYVGNITIGVSDKQIKAMLDSPLFRMVIPYHASGMLPQFAQLVGVDMYNDYTNYQNTTVREIRLLNDTEYTVKIGDNGKPKVVKNADGKDVSINTHYAFNEMLQKYGDARKTCQDYLAWCRNEHPIYDKGKVIGYATFNAKFSDSPTGVDFTKHRNYYKLIEDFNTYDNITEKATQQGAVTMTFPSAENRLTAEQKSAYEKALRDTGIFTEADIKKYLKKADMTFEDIVREEVGNRKAYNDAQEPKFDSTVKEVEDYLLNAKDDKGNYKFRRDAVADTASDYIEAKNHGISLKPATGSYLDEITKLGADYGVDKLSDRRTIRNFDHSADAIARNVEAVAGMDSVHDVPASALEDSGLPINEIYQEFFDKWGGELFSEELGVIDVKPSSIRSEKRHGSTAQKIASIEAIPTVVSEGKVIFANYKSGTDVLRIVVAAPIKIADKPYYMGVMVQRDSKFQRLYLHDVVIEEETPNFSQVDLLTTGTDEKNERLFVTTILQQALNVKFKSRSERDSKTGIVEQKISSAKTSIKQIPALFKDKNVSFGKTNIDIGGGKFDLATDYLAEIGTKNYVFDPYNRSEDVNRNTLAFLQNGNKADTATCANVLNVIAESGARANVILEVAKSIKDDGTAYFMVYEGDSSGVGRETSAGWQNNRKTADYVQEISQYFDSVERKGKLIIAKNPAKNLPMATWEVSPGKGILYSDRVLMGSLFSGGGTLEAGLVYQMLDKEFAVEYNKQIAATYTDNHGKEHMFVGDVRDFDSKDKQNVFYLHASPVCKNFSAASHSGGETTLDITTAQATARVLEEQMPQVFTVENVKRYIGSEAYNIITDKLTELGYTWDVDVYKASDYGNATKRERMIIRAVKDGQLPAKPQKVSSITSWGEATKDLWETDLIPSTLVKSKIEAIRNTPALKNIRLTKLDKPLMIYDTTKSKQITYAWADELAPTLTTKCGDARIIMPDGKVYAPTPKFMGRIQGLPDDYKYPKSTTRAFTIIGNGIPTQLTKAVMGGVLDSAYEQTHEGKVLYQDRSGNSVSRRALLANALESTIDSSTPDGQIELKKLKEYKEMIGTLDELSHKLANLRNDLFSKGVTGEERKKIQEEATKTANRISIYDKKLLTLEASKPLKKVLDREKAQAVKKQKAIDAENLAAYKRESEAKLNKQKERYMESRKKVKELRGKLKERAENYRESSKRVKETRDKNEAKETLQKLVLETAKWISYPKKGDVKCPDILRVPYADFLKNIDFSSKTLLEKGEQTKNDMRMIMAMDSLATAIERIQTAQNPETENAESLDIGYLDLPPHFVKYLREMVEKAKGMMVDGDYVINQMTSGDIKQLTKLIRTINHSIKEMSTLYSNLRFANVEALGDESISFMDVLGEIDATNGVSDFWAWDNALAYYAFKRFGKSGESVFEELMDAQDKLAFLSKGIIEFREKAWTLEESQLWSEDTHTITLPSGKTLTLTTADAMSIYCLHRRDNEQGLKHLIGGGVRVVGQTKGATKAKDSRVELDLDDVMAICDSLNDRQVEVAEAIQEYMSTVCSEWGNEISMKRFLTRDFVEKRYFPIQSNDEALAVRDPKAQQSDLFRLLNISATKPLTPNANNSVIIRNIFDVFTEHTSDMARLNAYGMALLDYMKWLNYSEKTTNEKGQVKVRGVRSSMNKAYGEKALSYAINLVKDINGRFNDGGDHPWLMKMTRTAKTAAVGSSLRVAALQFTAYPRAAMVLSTANLAKGLSKRPQISKAKQYCGIALWKSFGFYDTNIAKSIEDQIKGTKDWKNKLIELSLKGAEWGDSITWGYLWNACEYDVATSNKQLRVGSEEFNQAVGKRLREVIYSTQVVDSVLTRSQIMRNKSGLTQATTAFMSEPTVTANIMMDACFQFNLEKRRTGSAKLAWKKAGGQITKAVTVFGVTSILTALVESLVDAYRDDEDEEFLAKFGKAMLQNSVSDLLLFNKIPIFADVVEAVLSLFDLGYFSTDRLDTTWLSDSVKAANSWKSVLGEAFGVKDTSVTVYKALYDTVKALSSTTGVSFSGLLREIITLWNNTAGAANPDLKVQKYED